jgi:hypothetical protein
LKWKVAFKKLLDGLPSKPEMAVAAAIEAKNDFQNALADFLEDSFFEYLSRKPHTSLAEKRSLATHANEVLRELGLSIQCPKTGRNGILVADFNHSIDRDNSSRFRIESKDELGKQYRASGHASLPRLHLVPRDLREEPLSRKRGR